MSFHQSATEPAATNVLPEPAPPSPTAKQQEVDGDIALVAERYRVVARTFDELVADGVPPSNLEVRACKHHQSVSSFEPSLRRLVIEQLASQSGVSRESNEKERSESKLNTSVLILVLLPDGSNATEPCPLPPPDVLPEIDDDRYSLWWGGKEIQLENTDRFRIACHLIRRRGRKVLHYDIGELLGDGLMTSVAIRSAISRLKAKLPPDLAGRIKSGAGYYRFD